MLDRLSLIDVSGNRLYLLEKTQHIIGGFGKGVGELPGKANWLLHCLISNRLLSIQISSTPTWGLVSLALLNEPGLGSADPTLCASTRLNDLVKSLPWWQEKAQSDSPSRTSGGKIDYLTVSGG